jgi:hypothetical protein
MFSTFGYFFRSVSPRVFLLEKDQWNRIRDLVNVETNVTIIII